MKVDLQKSLFILPNLVTLSSIFCGFYAIVLCVSPIAPDTFQQAALVLVIAMFLDTVDGRVARITKTQSTIGVQLDSLADVISFGVCPALLVYLWSLHQLGLPGLFVSFVYLACGVIRLARFNVLTMGKRGTPKKPSKYIVGFPIPAGAGVLLTMIIVNHVMEGKAQSYPMVVMAIVLTMAFLMVSKVQFRSFKDIKFSARTVLLILYTISSTIFVAVRFHASFALVWLLGHYILIALVETVFTRIKKRKKKKLLHQMRKELGQNMSEQSTPEQNVLE